MSVLLVSTALRAGSKTGLIAESWRAACEVADTPADLAREVTHLAPPWPLASLA